MVTIGDMRKKVDESFLELFATLAPMNENAHEVEENKDEVVKKLDAYTKKVDELRKLVQEHQELRVGNILNAAMEGSELISDEGKGVLTRLKKGLNAESVNVEMMQQLVSTMKQRHDTMVKFLEAESKVEIR